MRSKAHRDADPRFHQLLEQLIDVGGERRQLDVPDGPATRFVPPAEMIAIYGFKFAHYKRIKDVEPHGVQKEKRFFYEWEEHDIDQHLPQIANHLDSRRRTLEYIALNVSAERQPPGPPANLIAQIKQEVDGPLPLGQLPTVIEGRRLIAFEYLGIRRLPGGKEKGYCRARFYEFNADTAAETVTFYYAKIWLLLNRFPKAEWDRQLDAWESRAEASAAERRSPASVPSSALPHTLRAIAGDQLFTYTNVGGQQYVRDERAITAENCEEAADVLLQKHTDLMRVIRSGEPIAGAEPPAGATEMKLVRRDLVQHQPSKECTVLYGGYLIVFGKPRRGEYTARPFRLQPEQAQTLLADMLEKLQATEQRFSPPQREVLAPMLRAARQIIVAAANRFKIDLFPASSAYEPAAGIGAMEIEGGALEEGKPGDGSSQWRSIFARRLEHTSHPAPVTAPAAGEVDLALGPDDDLTEIVAQLRVAQRSEVWQDSYRRVSKEVWRLAPEKKAKAARKRQAEFNTAALAAKIRSLTAKKAADLPAETLAHMKRIAEEATLLQGNLLVGGKERPTRAEMNDYLRVHAGERLEDEENERVVRVLQAFKQAGSKIVFEPEGRRLECTVSTKTRKNRPGRRFFVQEVGGNQREIVETVYLPRLYLE